MLKDILAYVGGVAAFLTLLVGITLAVCRIFATKWIENRFSERLEAFRHEQAKEMEHLRFRVNAQLDRLTKLHQQEFEALPQFWALANKAYARTSAVASGFGLYPDLERMTEAEFLEKTESTSLVLLRHNGG